MWIYLADVDHAGHSGNLENYTSTIHNADRIVGELWDYLQADPFYQNSTTLIVTNDHGRHNDEHGGFQGHGCGCEGCRHIQFLAVGPNIKQGHVSTTYRTIPDMAVTAAHILDVDPVKATGNIMYEIFESSAIEDSKTTHAVNFTIFPNPITEYSQINFNLRYNSEISIEISDIFGRIIKHKQLGKFGIGKHSILWPEIGFSTAGNKPGFYFLTLKTKTTNSTLKILIGGF